MERVKQKKDKTTNDNIACDIPTAPTLEDFYFDPGISTETTEPCDQPETVSSSLTG